MAVCEQTETRDMMDKRIKGQMEVKREQKAREKEKAKEEGQQPKDVQMKNEDV